MIKRVAALVFIANETTDVVNNQLGVIPQREPTSRRIAEQLISNATKNPGNDLTQCRPLISLYMY